MHGIEATMIETRMRSHTQMGEKTSSISMRPCAEFPRVEPAGTQFGPGHESISNIALEVSLLIALEVGDTKSDIIC